MTERPILFSAPMVRAILAGQKTQTRRIMKVQPYDGASPTVERYFSTVIDRRGEEQPGPEIFGAWWGDGECGVACPYGQPGDRLWVRESYRLCAEFDASPPCAGNAGNRVWYEANAPHQPGFGKGRPSIHMPRWASRITLEITGVRVERLQAISEADAVAEGIETMAEHDRDMRPTGRLNGLVRYAGEPPQWGRPREAFQALWTGINGGESWDANPWVWVVAFRRLES